MSATAETINFEAEALAATNANVPALERQFGYGDVGASVTPLFVERHPFGDPATDTGSRPTFNQCRKDILAEPDYKQAILLNAGKHNQTFDLRAWFGPVRPGCDDNRLAQAKTEIQDPGDHGRWIPSPVNYWKTIYPRLSKGLGGLYSSSNGHQGNRVYYKYPCPAEPAASHARFIVRILMEDPATQEVKAQRNQTIPAKVEC